LSIEFKGKLPSGHEATILDCTVCAMLRYHHGFLRSRARLRLPKL
jgi:hypothetical protein